MNSAEIGDQIKKERKSMGLRQAELASVAGVSVRTLSDIENGKQTAHIGLVLKIIESLGMTLTLTPFQHTTVLDEDMN